MHLGSFCPDENGRKLARKPIDETRARPARTAASAVKKTVIQMVNGVSFLRRPLSESWGRAFTRPRQATEAPRWQASRGQRPGGWLMGPAHGDQRAAARGRLGQRGKQESDRAGPPKPWGDVSLAWSTSGSGIRQRNGKTHLTCFSDRSCCHGENELQWKKAEARHNSWG